MTCGTILSASHCEAEVARYGHRASGMDGRVQAPSCRDDRSTLSHAQEHQRRQSSPGPQYSRQAFHHARVHMGATSAAGHWIHILSVAAPLVIPEVIQDRDQQWRAMRLASVGAALASEAVWTYKIAQDRQREQECRTAAMDTSAQR